MARLNVLILGLFSRGCEIGPKSHTAFAMKPQLNGYNVSKCRSDGSTGGRKDDDGDADDKKYVVTLT